MIAPLTPDIPNYKHYTDELDYWSECLADIDSDPFHHVVTWYLTRIPINAFGFMFNRSELGTRFDANAEDDRDQRIKKWAESCGTWDAALWRSPPIVLWHDGRLDKVDGWHRLKLARAAGVEIAWCLLGHTAPGTPALPWLIDQHTKVAS